MPIKIILNMPRSDKEAESSTLRTTAAVDAYDAVMQEHEQQLQQDHQQSVQNQAGGMFGADGSNDVVMGEGATPPVRHHSPAILPGATTGLAPTSGNHTPSHNTPSRTPNAALNGSNQHIQEAHNTSRATSQHPETASTPTQQLSTANFPKTAAVHGAPTRQYLNGKVTSVLLEGMKLIAKDQPKDPLRVLGEYLLQRSKEIEGT